MLDSTEILREVVEGTNQATGREYFRALARGLAHALRVRYCFVTECLDSPPSRVATLAFWAGEKFAVDFEYNLLATPCEKVFEGNRCAYGEGIQDLFPDDEDLVYLEAESYAAVPLVGYDNDVIGHLAILDPQALTDPPLHLALLELFAARAAAELERQRATVRLANSEARLRQVIDLVPHFIFAKDQEGRFILANRAVAEAYGTTVENLTGKSDADFAASSAEVERFRRDDLEVIGSGKTKFISEEAITDAAGRARLLQTTKIPFHFTDSRRPAVLGVSTDITERRRYEKALRSIVEGTAGTVGESFFRSLTRHLAEALATRYAVVAELDGERVRARAVWGGKSFLPALEYSLPGSPCEQVVRQQKTTLFPQDLQQIFPDHFLPGDLGAESYLGTPLFDVHRQPIGLLAVLDPRPMGDSVRNGYLLSIFASRAAAELERERLEAHRRNLQSQILHTQKLESLGVLAGGIAHDFNNLLCGILGNLDLALLQVDDRSQVHARLRDARTAAQRSAELANQMLAYSGKGKFVTTRFNLNWMIEEMLDLLRASISKKAQLHLDLSRSLPVFEGDATQLRQVVMNLVINASDAIGNRPGQIHIRTGVREVDRGFLDKAFPAAPLPEGPYLVIEVEDDGCGMDEETKSRLFDPFYTTKKSGRGLGLAALLGIVRGHQGAVRVKSAPGEGSTFAVLLPGRSEPATASLPASASARSWHGAGTVLLVDDEDVVRSATRPLLEHLGFEVLLAEDGRQAIEIFRRRRSDIRAVVLDMMMPELDGLETFRELRRIDPEVKTLLTSGFSRQAIPESFERDELAGFLQKPLRLGQLESKLREILS